MSSVGYHTFVACFANLFVRRIAQNSLTLKKAANIKIEVSCCSVAIYINTCNGWKRLQGIHRPIAQQGTRLNLKRCILHLTSQPLDLSRKERVGPYCQFTHCPTKKGTSRLLIDECVKSCCISESVGIP